MNTSNKNINIQIVGETLILINMHLRIQLMETLFNQNRKAERLILHFKPFSFFSKDFIKNHNYIIHFYTNIVCQPCLMQTLVFYINSSIYINTICNYFQEKIIAATQQSMRSNPGTFTNISVEHLNLLMKFQHLLLKRSR